VAVAVLEQTVKLVALAVLEVVVVARQESPAQVVLVLLVKVMLVVQ
jgi:hypothetical protein